MDELRSDLHIAGISPLESWEWTWGEAVEMVEAYRARENQRAHITAVSLYNAAAFLTDSIGKQLAGCGQLMPFDKAFPGFSQKKGAMTDDEMLQVAMQLVAQCGGEVIYDGRN